MDEQTGRPIEILLVEDNPGDVRLTEITLRDAKVRNNMRVAEDGEAALAILHQRGEYSDEPRPDLVLLDLKLPGKDGGDVLAEIKNDPHLKRIPVVVLTTSKADKDVLGSYDLHANAYITKPVDLDEFIAAVKAIEDFWLTIVRLPRE